MAPYRFVIAVKPLDLQIPKIFLALLIFQVTINTLAEFFKATKGVDLEVLTSATLMKLEEIKEKTAAGKFYPCMHTHSHTHTHTHTPT